MGRRAGCSLYATWLRCAGVLTRGRARARPRVPDWGEEENPGPPGASDRGVGIGY